MASYYVSGYSPPAGVMDRNSVASIQQQLNANGANLKVDGIWGPKTQAAYGMGSSSPYGSYSSTSSSLVPADFKSILAEVQGLIKPATMSYTGMGRGEIEAGLRPTFDLAIEGRRKQTGTNKANIDVDAASRGMGSSTWVTDVKNRQQNAEASDVASIEAAYAQQLMAALQQQEQNRLQVEQFNANANAQAMQAALGLAGNLYGQHLTTAKAMEAAAKKGSSSRSSTGSAYTPMNDGFSLADKAYAGEGTLFGGLSNLNKYASGYSDEERKKAATVLSQATNDYYDRLDAQRSANIASRR